MCGRTGLNLNRDCIQCACAYKPPGSNGFVKPDWTDAENCGRSFRPSTNIAPSEVTPVLLADDCGERILQPMMWGMIPPWHKGEYNKHGLSTHNCRAEGITTSKLYGAALERGLRCVVVAEGFYEWQTTSTEAKVKQPYYIYCKQDDRLIETDSTPSLYDDVTGWKGTRLLKMAALYNRWEGPQGSLLSYAVVTLQSNDTLSWLHHRMPAILDSDEDIQRWLNPSTDSREAVTVLKETNNLSWHPVSTAVNNAKNKSVECNTRIDIQTKETASQKLMTNWLGTKRKETIRNVASSKNIMNNWLARNTKRKSDETDCVTKKLKIE